MKVFLPPLSYFCCFLFFTFSSVGQDKKTDSLISAWRSQPEDSNKVNTCNKLVIRFNADNPSTALLYADSGISVAQKINFQKGLADLLNQKGGSYTQLGNMQAALEAYLKSYEIRKSINDLRGIAGSLNNIGRVHENLENYPLALSYYKQAVAMNIKMGNKKWETTNYINMGVLYGKRKMVDSSIYYQEKALQIAQAENDERGIAFCCDNLGVAYTVKQDFEKALKYNQAALALRRKGGDKFLVALSLVNTSYSYIRMNQPDKALPIVEEALKLSEESDYMEGQRLAYEYLSEIYEEKKDYRKALDYHRKFTSIRDSMIAMENAGKIAKMQALFDKEVSEKEIAKLRSNELQKNKKIETQNYWIWVAVLASLLVVAVAIILFIRTRFKTRDNKQLNQLLHDLEIIESIGKKITSSISVEDINQTVYQEINKMMDASGFGIGLLNEKDQTLVFSGYLEKGKRLPEAVYRLEDKNRLAVWVVDNKKGIIINDFEKEIHQYIHSVRDPLAGEHVYSLIYIPLISKSKLLGTITVQSFKRNSYNSYHFRILENIASYAAIALENAMLYENMEGLVQLRTKEVILQKEELEKNYSNTQLLSEMGQEITSTLKFEDIFSRLYENVNRLMPAEVFGVRLYHPDKNAIEYKFEYENGVAHPPLWVSMDDDNNYSVWSVKNKKEIFINDNLAEYSKYVNQIRVVAGDMPHSLIFYPLMVGEKILGVISIQSFSKQAYKPIHLSILKTLASYTAIALENANLYETLEEKVIERTKEVVNQKLIIEEKNKDITDSIRYAKKIQTALLPGMAKINSAVENFFILYQPRDIVSGDFYYFTKRGHLKIFAVADCTGHGVPGAIISAICINLLSEVVYDKAVNSPGEALQQIDTRLKTLLKQEQGGQSNDGMDCGICVLNSETNTLHYAGAHRPMLVLKDGELTEIKYTKHSIGGHDTSEKKFVSTEFQAAKGDRFYLFTDGYADQFGGPKGKKFKYKKMKDLILANKEVSLPEQRDIFHEELITWKGGFEQVDDILVMGVEV
jgi:serine phosphatase RsbU (regulator of sigma subunit)/tetratricopeptide (TPR) repeat protein